MNKEINVRKETKAKYKSHLGYSLSYGAFYAFIIIASMTLAFFLPETLVLTIPLVIIPFTFGFQFNTVIDNNSIGDQGFSIKNLFCLFPYYFKRNFFGVYRLIEGLLKALVVFIGFYSFAALICVYGTIFSDPEIANMISSIEMMDNMANIEEEVFNVLLNNDTFMNAMYLAIGIAVFPSLLMFLHHIGTNSIKIHLEVASGQKIPMRETHFIHRLGFKTFRKQFYKDYFKTVWWFTPLLAVLYYSGMCLGYFLFNKNPIEMSIIGLALTLFVLSFILPYYFSTIETLFAKYQNRYIEASIRQSIITLNQLKAQKQLSEIEEEEIKKYIAETEIMLQKEENKDDEEQKNSDDSEP